MDWCSIRFRLAGMGCGLLLRPEDTTERGWGGEDEDDDAPILGHGNV